LPIRTERPPTLLLYTRFWEFSIDFLLQAFALVVQQYPAVRLLIIGRGERGEEQQLLAQATQMGVIGQIDYCGWVEPEAIPALLAGADVALVPMNDTLINRARGLAKLLELMSYGLPIVANRVGQVAEYLVDRQSGVLVPPGDVLAFAQAALLVLTNQGLQAELAAGAQARAALFGWDRLAETAALAYQRARI
jgi:glycosyltransferase involved in cell wall biosynthesis